MLYMINPWQGTISRGKWWLLSFFQLIFASAVLIFVTKGNASLSGFLLGLLVCIWTNFSISSNRLRDIEKSPWFFLINIIPFGCFVLFYFLAFEKGASGKQPSSKYDDPTPNGYKSNLDSIDFSNYQMPPQPSSGFAPRQRAEARPAPFAKPMGTRPAPTGFGRRGL